MKKMLTRREVFEKVKAHLLAQGDVSLTDGECAYRSQLGLMCAAGCLIDESKYSHKFEGKNVKEDSVGAALLNSGVDMEDWMTEAMVLDLQNMHDGVFVSPGSSSSPAKRNVEKWPEILDQIEQEYLKS